MEWLLSLDSESFVFQFAVQKIKILQNYNFACCFWVRNLVSSIVGGK